MFDETYQFGEALLKGGLILPSLEHCLKCSHLFNLLDSSGSVGVTERMAYILRVRQLALAICKEYVGQQEPGAGSRPASARDASSGEVAPERLRREGGEPGAGS
jgi:glycyl-tRNA synthetase alpha chain